MDFFEQGVASSYANYQSSGARSNQKVIPLHGGIALMYDGILNLMALEPEKFSIISQGYKGITKEYQARTLIGTKNVDVAILHNDDLALVNSVKFPTGNYAQNANNYMESAQGEMHFMRRVNPKTVLAYTVVIASKIPYLKKAGAFDRNETLTSATVKKYAILADDPESFPEYLIFSAIDTNNSQHFVKGQVIDWAVAGAEKIIFPKTADEYLIANPTLDRDDIAFLVEHGNAVKGAITQLEDMMSRQGASLHPDWETRKRNLLSSL